MMNNFMAEFIWKLTVNDVSTRDNSTYPDLSSPTTSEDPDHIIEAVRSVFEEKSDRWHIIEVDRDDYVIKAEIDTTLFGFTDDVTIEIETSGNAQPDNVIHVRSCSRVGKGDLGKNANNIREILNQLDDRIVDLSDGISGSS